MNEYYLIRMPQKKFKKMCARKKIQLPRPCMCNGTAHFSPGDVLGLFNKVDIDKFPRYMRRGGVYGTNDQALNPRPVSLRAVKE